eukprot:XP_003725852.1 PREDICTED: serine/arginine repetitive matrix protein 2-like [Strongylocentrotus purpuratus]
MSDFKAKYQALQILQRLASGEKLPGKERSQSLSPRKPGIRNSDDILKEKYNELAELVALQHLEKQAVSALQKMYVSPPKGERRSRTTRRRRKDGETKRKDGETKRKDGETRRRRKEDGEREESKKQRPISASSSSSNSSHSSSASFASRTSSMSNSSRSSSMTSSSRSSTMTNSSRASSRSSRSSTSSNSSRTSSMSNSSKSSTRSKSSSTPKPVERHFVTIVEEEEEEEVIDQDAIKERQIVQFDEELAQENEEEAKQKKDASKRIRKVSFVLETQEKSSDDEGGMEEQLEDILNGDERFVPGEESSPSSSRQQRNDREHDDAGDHTPRYIEIENSLLREILSPRSPRRGYKFSQRSEERSPTRDRSKSPKRRQQSPSPKKAWEVPLPPRPVKDINPCDHKLSNTDNPEIKKWLRHKNALIRRERKAELKEEREERRAAEAVSQKRDDRLAESGEFYDSWVKQKKKDLRRQRRIERILAKEEKRRLEEENAKREELFQEKLRMSVASFGERVPTPRKEKIQRTKSGKSNSGENSSKSKRKTEKEKNKVSDAPGKQTYPSSNPFKGVTYDEWMRQKMKEDEMNQKKERRKKKMDPDLEDIIPNVAKERIERAKVGKGKRVNTGLRKEKDERPECDRPSSEKTDAPKSYRWSNDETSASSEKHNAKGSDVCGRGGLQRPTTARNHIRNAPRRQRAPPSSSDKVRGPAAPSFARPEPQGSESNDDHSEHGANIQKGRPTTQRSTDGKNNKGRTQNGEGRVWEKALVEKSHSHTVPAPEDLSVFLTEFDG